MVWWVLYHRANGASSVSVGTLIEIQTSNHFLGGIPALLGEGINDFGVKKKKICEGRLTGFNLVQFRNSLYFSHI